MNNEMVTREMVSTDKKIWTQRDATNESSPIGICFRPFFRQGLLAGMNPRLDQNQLTTFQNEIGNKWESWRCDFLDTLEKRATADPYNRGNKRVSYDEKEVVWIRTEDEIHFIDFPRMYIWNDGKKCQDIRMCIGLCNKKLITNKFWARITLPSLKESPNAWIPAEYLSSYADFYREVTASLCTSLHDKSNQVLQTISETTKKKDEPLNEKVGWLEVAAFGLNDPELNASFKTLSDYSLTSKQIVELPHVDERLTRYFGEVVQLEGQISSLIEKSSKNQADISWFTSPSLMDTNDRSTEQMNIFFMMRQINDRIQAIGFGPDFSSSGELARYTVRKTASYIYNII
jgi:hypothetical protein